MGALTAVEDRHVVVAVATPARVQSASRFRFEVLASAACDFFPFKLRGEAAKRHHDLVGRAVERDLVALEVAEEPLAALHHVLHHEPGPVHVTTKPRVVAQDNGVKFTRTEGI